MRNTKAKKLRRKAEEMTTGKPEVSYLKVRSHKGRKTWTRPYFTQLHPDCTRSVYQNIKKTA